MTTRRGLFGMLAGAALLPAAAFGKIKAPKVGYTIQTFPHSTEAYADEVMAHYFPQPQAELEYLTDPELDAMYARLAPGARAQLDAITREWEDQILNGNPTDPHPFEGFD